MADLSPILPKIGPLVRLMASPVDGEALGAARALGRVLAGAGASFSDLADRIQHPITIYREANARSEAPASTERKILEAMLNAEALSDWETRFVISILAAMRTRSTWRASPKQRASIDLILAKAETMGMRP